MSNNFLGGLQFAMSVARLPETAFSVQSLSLPGVSASPVMRSTPFITTPIPGDHMDFSPLSVNFILDDEMKNYQEIFDWMVKLYFPDNFDQYKTLVDVKPGGFGLISDLTLSVLTAGSNKNKSIVFYDAFPISIGELQFNYQNSDVEYVTCSVQFQFKSFDFVE